jgi:hypothetical protein
VTLDAAQPYQERVAALLHECGHVLVYLRRKRTRARVAGATFTEWWNASGRLQKRSKLKRITVLEEEIHAWNLGEKLARRLRIRVCKRVFERCRADALRTYC